MTTLQLKIDEALWIAHSLFERGKTSGSTGNLSFRHENKMYVTAGGTCFGTLSGEDFAVFDLETSTWQNERKPSKEWPLHRAFYAKSDTIGAVIHTHGPFAALWSCRKELDEDDAVPRYTPYLRMKVGQIGVVPYAPPGSPELFAAFEAALPCAEGFLLRNHGGIVAGRDLMDAFAAIEELEESCRTACFARLHPEEYALIGR